MLLRNQSAPSFDVTMGTASENINLIECLILPSVVSSIDWDTTNMMPLGIVQAFSYGPSIDLFAKL